MIVSPKTKRRQLDGRMLEAVLEIYRQGLSSPKIAKLVGFSQRAVSLHVKRAGLTRPTKTNNLRFGPRHLELAAEAYRSGMSSPAIARRLGFSQSVVSKWLRRAGVKRGLSLKSQALGRRILRLRLAGATYAKIVDELGVNVSTVAAHLRRAGYPGRQNKQLTRAECQRILRLRARGLTLVAIAERVGRNHSTVRGLVLESQGRRPRRPRLRANNHEEPTHEQNSDA